MVSEITVFAITLVILCSANNYDLNLCNSSETSDYTNYTTTRTENCGCAEEGLCVRKCCQMGFVYVFDEQANVSVCIKSATPTRYSVPIYERKNKKYDKTDNFMVGMLDCTSDEHSPPYFDLDNSIPDEKYYVQENGTLYYSFSPHKFYNNSRYCVDEVKGVFVCWTPTNKDPSLGTSRRVNGLSMIISLPFLVATLIVVAVTRKSSLHKKALILFVLTLSFGYSMLIGIEFYPYRISLHICSTLGYSVLFFLLAAFLWLNVICWDIWFTFSGRRGINRNVVSGRKNFIYSSLYAWGITIILILIMLLLDVYGDEDANWYPGVGNPRCFIRHGLPHFIFLYMPIIILITFNFILFVLTAHNIRKIEKQTSSFRNNDSQIHSRDADKQRKTYQLYLKLLFGTGINWGMEVVSFIIIWVTGHVHFILYLVDMLNAMYGIFVFFIFVFKEEHWLFLKKRCCSLFRKETSLAESAGNISSASTTDTVLTELEHGNKSD